MKRLDVIWLFLLACNLIAERPCYAQKASEPLQTVTYDLGKMLHYARPDDKPNPKIGPVDPDAPIGRDTQIPTLTESRDSLINIFKDVDPPSWKADHNPHATIAIDGEKMIVSQTKANHRQIARMLKELREGEDGSGKISDTFNHIRLAKAKFEKTPLAEAIQAIAAEAKIPIEVDWNSFRKFAVFADSPTTLELTKPTACRAIRALFKSAAGFQMDVSISATPRTIRIYHYDLKPGHSLSRALDVSPLPARVCGLDPKKSYTRAQAMDALAERIKKELPDIKDLRVHNAGMIMLGGPEQPQLQVIEYLDELDEEAMKAIKQ